MVFSSKEIKENVVLAPYTTYKIGGPARYFWEMTDRALLPQVLAEVQAANLPYLVLGGGSNILFSDEGFPGLVILNKLQNYRIDEGEFWVEGGLPWSQFLAICLEHGLSGLERMAGIPGTVGGAVRGNAGIYDCEISKCLNKGTVLTTAGEIVEWTKGDFEFAYRESRIKRAGGIILDVTFNLTPAQPEEMQEVMNQMISERREKHPWGPSCGSFFKNPRILIAESPVEWRDKFYHDGDLLKVPAGFLIEQVGGKGMREGGAVVSLKHANFILNEEAATAHDVKTLAERLQTLVKEKFDVELEPEVAYV